MDTAGSCRSIHGAGRAKSTTWRTCSTSRRRRCRGCASGHTRCSPSVAAWAARRTLLLIARHRRLLRGAAAFDAPTDLARRYRDFPRIPGGRHLQELARRELGGTPDSSSRRVCASQPDRSRACGRVFPGATAALLERRRRGGARPAVPLRPAVSPHLRAQPRSARHRRHGLVDTFGRNAADAAPRAPRLRSAPRWGCVTPMPPFPQRYNDGFRGWPVRPHNRQHPVRGSFLDPRPDPEQGGIYHTGVDIAVRDDHPEQGAPVGRTHRVYAIEGGVVEQATPPGVCGDAPRRPLRLRTRRRPRRGRRARPCRSADRLDLPGLVASPRDGVVLQGRWWPSPALSTPFVRPASSSRSSTGATRDPRGALLHPSRTALGQARRGTRPACRRRAVGSTGRSFPASSTSAPASAIPSRSVGWFRDVPALAAPHHPYRLGLLLLDRAGRTRGAAAEPSSSP